jgi:hypothetical protein
VILDHDSASARPVGAFHWPTLDELLLAAVERRPDAPALTDPPDRYRFTDGPPRRLTFAEVDRAVNALAAHLRACGLPLDSVIGLQLPNTVESVIALLGVLRAGLIAAPLPLLWRQAEAVEALSRVGARGLITSRLIGGVDHGELARLVAADLFSIRFVGAFGRNPPEGVDPLDRVFAAPPPETELMGRSANPADHVAVVTFETTDEGVMPVARSHAQLLAGGLAIALEGRVQPMGGILASFAATSFAGLSATVVLWLLDGGMLSLHHPFDADWFSTQFEGERCLNVVVPGPLVGRLAEAGLFEEEDASKVIAVWRAPERRQANVAVRLADIVDVLAFGEIGLVPVPRTVTGKPAPLPERAIGAPSGASAAIPLVDVARIAGSLALGGVMVPRRNFPLGSGMGPVVLETGFVDTGYPCRSDEAGNLVLDGPPPGMISIGGYRFVLKDLQEAVANVGEEGTLAVLPDILAGYRLAGIAGDRDAVRRALLAHGVNALIVNAFGERSGEQASAA